MTLLRNSASSLVLAASMATGAQAEDAWSWTFTPYALAPFIDGDTSIGRLSSVGINVDPTDIIDVLDAGIMLAFEGLHENSGWGFMLDYSFMDLADSGTFAGGAGTASASIFQGIFNANVYRRVIAEPDRIVDVYGGIRWWDMDIDVTAQLGGPPPRVVNVSEDWVDPHIGVRYKQQLANDAWSFLAQGDIGGFGIASDFAWTLKAGFVWQARENFALDLSYKAVGVDYETGTPGTPSHFAYDTITHGPYLGLVFTF